MTRLEINKENAYRFIGIQSRISFIREWHLSDLCQLDTRSKIQLIYQFYFKKLTKLTQPHRIYYIKWNSSIIPISPRYQILGSGESLDFHCISLKQTDTPNLQSWCSIFFLLAPPSLPGDRQAICNKPAQYPWIMNGKQFKKTLEWSSICFKDGFVGFLC